MRVRGLSGTVLGNVGLTVVALVFSGLVPFAFNLLVGRRYGAEALGEISLVLSVTLFLGQIPGTLGATVTKFVAEALGRGDTPTARATFQVLFVLNLLVACVLALGLLLASSKIEAAFHLSSTRAFLLGGCLVIFYAQYIFLKSSYYGVGRVDAYVRNEIVSDVAFFLGLGILLASSVAGDWLLACFVLNNLVFTAFALRDLSPFFQGFRWRRRPSTELVGYSLVTGGGTVASLARQSLMLPIAGLFLSHSAVGWFAGSVAILTPLYLMPRALSLVLFADMARLYGAGEGGSIRRLLQQSTEALVFFPGLLCGLVLINASTILEALFSRPYTAATTAMQLVVLGAYLGMVATPSIDVLSSTRYIRIPTIAAWLALPVSVVTWFTLMPSLSITGVGAGYLTGTIVTGLFPLILAYRRFQTAPLVYLRAGLVVATMVVAMVLPGRYQLVVSLLYCLLVIGLYARFSVSLHRQLRDVRHSKMALDGKP